MFVNLLGHGMPQLLDDVLGVGLEEDDNGVELGVVEAVHGVGCDVQQRMLAAVHDCADARQPDDARSGLALALLHGAVKFWI